LPELPERALVSLQCPLHSAQGPESPRNHLLSQSHGGPGGSSFLPVCLSDRAWIPACSEWSDHGACLLFEMSFPCLASLNSSTSKSLCPCIRPWALCARVSCASCHQPYRATVLKLSVRAAVCAVSLSHLMITSQ